MRAILIMCFLIVAMPGAFQYPVNEVQQFEKEVANLIFLINIFKYIYCIFKDIKSVVENDEMWCPIGQRKESTYQQEKKVKFI